MDQYGMRSIGLMVFLSFLVLLLFNHHATFDSSTSLSSSSSSSSVVRSFYGMEDLELTVAGGEMRRQLLQVTPAPGPSSATSTFISYGALTAGYVPCPPQTGRSYYTPNCPSATGPVNPYSRGCSTISGCARD